MKFQVETLHCGDFFAEWLRMKMKVSKPKNKILKSSEYGLKRFTTIVTQK
jgi:hypothetical protein